MKEKAGKKMIETITIPLNPNYSYEFPSRICLVCGKLEREAAKVVCSGDAWLCDRCRNTLLKLIKDSNAAANTSNALNAFRPKPPKGNEDG